MYSIHKKILYNHHESKSRFSIIGVKSVPCLPLGERCEQFPVTPNRFRQAHLEDTAFPFTRADQTVGSSWLRDWMHICPGSMNDQRWYTWDMLLLSRHSRMSAYRMRCEMMCWVDSPTTQRGWILDVTILTASSHGKVVPTSQMWWDVMSVTAILLNSKRMRPQGLSGLASRLQRKFFIANFVMTSPNTHACSVHGLFVSLRHSIAAAKNRKTVPDGIFTLAKIFPFILSWLNWVFLAVWLNIVTSFYRWKSCVECRNAGMRPPAVH